MKHSAGNKESKRRDREGCGHLGHVVEVLQHVSQLVTFQHTASNSFELT